MITRRHVTRMLYAVTAAGLGLAAMGFTEAGSTSAATAAPLSTGPPSYQAGWAGYTARGRWFRFASTTVTVPARHVLGRAAGSADIMLQGRGSLTPTQIIAEAGGGAGSVSWNQGTFRLSPRVGDRLALSIYYDRHGHDFLTATDITQRTTQTIRMHVPKMTYMTARVFAGVGTSTAPPKSDAPLWKFADSRLTTSSGAHGTLLGPWTTSVMIDTSTGTRAGRTVASPSGLSNGGRNFGLWLRALPRVYTPAFAGYANSGGPFRLVSTAMTVPARHVPRRNHGGVLVSLGHNGGPTPRPYADINLLAGGGPGSISYTCNAASGTFAVSPKPGDQLAAGIYYDQHGHYSFTVADTTQGTSQTFKASALYADQMPLNTAEVLVEIDGAVTSPPADIQLWHFTASRITTYSGEHGSVLGPWATSEWIDTIGSTPAGAVVMSASALSHSGQIFGVWLRHH
jgi:hypothetical protein